ncbi:MAG: putative PurR-regulated permease PerM [Polyangiales bacterium]|jgi:predicted PurR-regulated permease PerM
MESTTRSVRIAAWALAAAISLAVLWALRAVVTPIFFAFLIAYMLDPIVDRLEERKLPRAAGIVVLLVTGITVIAGFLLMVLPGVVRDVADFAGEVPGALQRLFAEWEPVLTSYGVSVPHSLGDLFERFGDDAQGVARQAVAPATAVLSWIVGGTASVAASVIHFFLIPVFTFYLLYDFDRITAAMRDLVPYRRRPLVVKLAGEVDDVLGQFIRGQLLVMLALAVLYAIGYSIVGVRLAIPIAIAAGLVSFIPYVGGGLALFLALGMCFFDWHGWDPIIGVLIVYGIVQVLEGFVITPAIVGDKVGLSAVWVLIALLAFGELFGFLGVLLAVPAAAIAKIFVVHGVARYRVSELFLEGKPIDESDIAEQELGTDTNEATDDEAGTEEQAALEDQATVEDQATDDEAGTDAAYPEEEVEVKEHSPEGEAPASEVDAPESSADKEEE